MVFLSILGGALLNEISGQFLLTKTLANRIATEATVNSSVETAIGDLQLRVSNATVPSRCSTDRATPVPAVTLNGQSATVSPLPSCLAIVPDVVSQLATGTYLVDGTLATVNGGATYLAAASNGVLSAYTVGQTTPRWSVRAGSGITGPVGQSGATTLVPVGSGVAYVDDRTASLQCTMHAAGPVTSRPGLENPPSGQPAYFPSYAFFGDTTGLNAQAFNGRTCTQMAFGLTAGSVVGGPLVLTGTVTTSNGGGEGNERSTTTTVELFAIVNGGGSSHLVHFSYQETRGAQNSSVLTPVDSVSLPFAVASGVAFAGTTPIDRQSIRMAITSTSGQVALAQITARNRQSGWTYTISSVGQAVSLGGSFQRPPYWRHVLQGGVSLDEIGAANTNGHLYVLDANNNLATRWHYDGSSPINTTPAPDSSGTWYFGADDGFVYDVEPPASGAVMFMAARFGPGGQVHASPSVAGCGRRVCIYFGMGSGGSYFAQIGDIRVMDLCARLASDAGGPCPGKSRLWARVEVGDPTYVQGHGVQVIGWTYFTS